MVIETKYPNPGPPKYSVPYSCANCGWSGNVVFAKGKRAPDTTTCPTCGVSGAKKSLPYKSPAPEKDPTLMPIIPGAWPKNPTPWPRVLPKPYPHPWADPRRSDIILKTRADNGEQRGDRKGGPVMLYYD